MMSKGHFFSVLAVLSFSPFLFADAPSPILLRAGEEIVFKGNKWDSATCDNKSYSQHDFGLIITSVSRDCNCDTQPVTRIYEDGLLKGICRTEYKINTPDMSENVFLDFKILGKLSDADLKKLLDSSAVGSCRFWNQSLGQPQKVAEAFQSYLVSTQDELRIDDENSPKVFIKAARDFIKDGHCGTSDNLSADQLKKTRKFLGRLDIGFDLLIAEGARGEDLVAMNYPAKKIKDRFNVSADLFKKAGYSARDLLVAGFAFSDLLNARYTVTDMYQAGVSVKDLKANFSVKDLFSAGVPASAMKAEGLSAKDLVAGGYGLRQLIEANYDVQKDVRPLFDVSEFIKVKDGYGSRVYSNQYLREKVGATAKELKDNGVAIQDLQQAGYDMLLEVKPLYTASDFIRTKDYYGSRVYSNEYLRKNLSYSAQDLKTAGIGLQELQQAGYNMLTEVKPLFTLDNFIKSKDYYGSRVYSNEYLRKNLNFSARELKDNGIGLQDLQQAGFDMVREIKPLYQVSDFIKAKDYYGSRVYTNDYLHRTLGYSASDLKSGGIGLSDLQQAGFDMLTEVKPLFTAGDFIKAKDYYGSRVYTSTYLRRDLGYSALELKTAGIGLRELYDAGFTKQQLRDAGFSNQEVDSL